MKLVQTPITELEQREIKALLTSSGISVIRAVVEGRRDAHCFDAMMLMLDSAGSEERRKSFATDNISSAKRYEAFLSVLSEIADNLSQLKKTTIVQ